MTSGPPPNAASGVTDTRVILTANTKTMDSCESPANKGKIGEAATVLEHPAASNPAPRLTRKAGLHMQDTADWADRIAQILTAWHDANGCHRCGPSCCVCNRRFCWPATRTALQWDGWLPSSGVAKGKGNPEALPVAGVTPGPATGQGS